MTYGFFERIREGARLAQSDNDKTMVWKTRGLSVRFQGGVGYADSLCPNRMWNKGPSTCYVSGIKETGEWSTYCI